MGDHNYVEAQSEKATPSRVKDLVKFLSTIKGDLANITAPPSFLAPCSVVENPRCWAERPEIFVAPAMEESSAKRSLLVLRMFLVGMRRQFYVGGAPGIGIRKPLNAFLGEIYISSWTADVAGGEPATVRLVSEQVSHHPPITAMNISSDNYGIHAEGYARVEMKFSGTLGIRQVGHTMLHIDRYEEHYLVPFPDVQVRGFLSMCLYPEIWGTYRIPSSSGYVAEIEFAGAGVFSGQRNRFNATVYHEKDDTKAPLYTVSGIWSQGWTIKDGSTGEVLEVYDVASADAKLDKSQVDRSRDIDEKDVWESNKAWADVLHGIRQGDLMAATKAKHRIEEAQRRMRGEEKGRGEVWRPLLFHNLLREKDYSIFHRLSCGAAGLSSEETSGVWRLDSSVLQNLRKPFRPGVTPLGYVSTQ